ncbi:MAG: hypothetical protein HAW64_04270 [Alphaproteobacteria bacterium]|nr:hypothetical protein [Alphaproteobacteria bacterium]
MNRFIHTNDIYQQVYPQSYLERYLERYLEPLIAALCLRHRKQSGILRPQ